MSGHNQKFILLPTSKGWVPDRSPVTARMRLFGGMLYSCGRPAVVNHSRLPIQTQRRRKNENNTALRNITTQQPVAGEWVDERERLCGTDSQWEEETSVVPVGGFAMTKPA